MSEQPTDLQPMIIIAEPYARYKETLAESEREASPVPKSKNPKFYRSWTQEEKQPDFEALCEGWEGRQPGCPVPADHPYGAPENGGEAE
jgi:hypothetical protein